jgi:hypothetical protein
LDQLYNKTAYFKGVKWILLDVAGSQFGGEGGIRTHVEAHAPHPISSRCRYGRFGTSPITRRLYSGAGLDSSLI